MQRLWLKRLINSTSLAIIGLLCFVLVALAIPASITNFKGTATSATVSLTWTKSASSDNTVIRHSATSYPATVADGSSTYNGSASYYTLSGLTSGTVYYFSAWGFDGSDYSVTVAEFRINTVPASSANTTIPFSQPSLPANVAEDPDISGWSISPIDDILDYFADEASAHGGLGMGVNNVVLFMASVGVTFVGLISYVKWRSFWTSWVFVLIGSGFFCTIEVMQWIVFGFLLLAGWGVWAIEKSTQ